MPKWDIHSQFYRLKEFYFSMAVLQAMCLNITTPESNVKIISQCLHHIIISSCSAWNLRHTGNLLTLRRYAKVVQLALPNDNLTKDANDFLCKILLSLQRNYDVSLPHNKIPDLLSALAKKMAIPAMPSGEEFKPEAAIVNYYGPSM